MLQWYFGNIELNKIHWTTLVHTSFERLLNETDDVLQPKQKAVLS